MRTILLLLGLLTVSVYHNRVLPTSTAMAQDQHSIKLAQLAQYCQNYLKLAQDKARQKTLTTEEKALASKLKDFLNIYAKANKEGKLTTSTTIGEEEEIGKTDFVEVCLKWHKAIHAYLTEKSQQYEGVKINLQAFAKDMEMNKTTVPISKALYTEWVAVVARLQQQGDTTTGKVLFEALRDHKGGAWEVTSNGSQLEAHYKENRKYYRVKTKIGSADFAGFSLPLPQIFEAALNMSISKNDPNLIENKEKVKLEAEREEKEALKQIEQDKKNALKRMHQRWDNWLNGTVIPSLGEIDTATEGKLIDVALLEKNREGYLDYPEYAKVYWQAVGDSILSKTKALQGTPSYEQVVTIAIRELGVAFDQHVTEEFLEKAVASGEQRLPSGVKRWIVSSIDLNDHLYQEFKNACQTWANSVRGLAGRAEAANNNRSFNVDRAKWAAQIRALFGGRAQPFMGTFEKELPKEKILTLKVTQEAWTKGLQAIQAEAYLGALWTEQFTKSDKGSVEDALLAFQTGLPTLDALAQKLLDARYFTPKMEEQPLNLTTIDSIFQIQYLLNWKDRAGLGERAVREALKEGKNVPIIGAGPMGITIDDVLTWIPETLVDSIDKAVDRVRIEVPQDSFVVHIPFENASIRGDKGQLLVYPKVGKVDSSNLQWKKSSPYKMSETNVKLLNTTTDNNSVIQVLQVTFNVQDVSVSTHVSSIAGISVGADPAMYGMRFELALITDYDSNGQQQVHYQIIGEAMPTINECPLQDNIQGPALLNFIGTTINAQNNEGSYRALSDN